MLILYNIITDRGSKYAVAGGACHSADEAKAFIKELKRKKKFAKLPIIRGGFCVVRANLKMMTAKAAQEW